MRCSTCAWLSPPGGVKCQAVPCSGTERRCGSRGVLCRRPTGMLAGPGMFARRALMSPGNAAASPAATCSCSSSPGAPTHPRVCGESRGELWRVALVAAQPLPLPLV